MSGLVLRPAGQCRYDLIALGEIMLRLDPGDGRVATTRSFSVSEGGGEYNVARGLRRCFGPRTGLITALADNPVGRLIEDLIYQGGVEQACLHWRQYDGVGRAVRNGLNFTERGFGVRAALGCSDRGHSAASQLRPGDVDWDRIFGVDGCRWLHTGGVFSALSPGTAELAAEAMRAAHRHGTVVSYDLNFRASLWQDSAVPAAEINDWNAVCRTRMSFHAGAPMPGLEIFDRIGGGDSFVSGLVYGLLKGLDVDTALSYGIAHGTLAMTTPGDTSMATLAEVRRLAAGQSARVIR